MPPEPMRWPAQKLWGSKSGMNAWRCDCQRNNKHGRTEKTCRKCRQRRPDGMR